MEKRVTVQQVGLETITNMVLREEAFSFNRRRGWVWLQRLCFSILRRLGCYYMEPCISIRRYDFDTGDFMERLFDSVGNVQEMFGRRPGHLIIGAEDFDELMSSSGPPTESFSFRAEYGHNRKILGLVVTVIPWMRGFVTLPSSWPVRGQGSMTTDTEPAPLADAKAWNP